MRKSALLIRRYDLVLSDLDGVAYAGKYAIPSAVEAYGQLKRDGIPIMFLTNNASRSTTTVASHLISLGIKTTPDCVVSAAAAAANLLEQQVPSGSKVYVIGTQTLRDEVRSRKMEIVEDGIKDFDQVDAVVQGHNPQTRWTDLAAASFAIEAGALWIAANTDRTIPLEQGIAPGNGSLVQAVTNATGKKPLVAGKPEPALFKAAHSKNPGCNKPLMLGDRLDTDIQGANTFGIDSVLVLTGVNTVHDVLSAPACQRPTYIIESLDELYQPYPRIIVEGHKAFIENLNGKSKCLGAVGSKGTDGEMTVEPIDGSVDSYRAANALLSRL